MLQKEKREINDNRKDHRSNKGRPIKERLYASQRKITL